MPRGICWQNSSNAASPPAEAPIATTTKALASAGESEFDEGTLSGFVDILLDKLI